MFDRFKLRESGTPGPPARSDHTGGSSPHLPTHAGPVPDKLSIWPMDDGRYGLDATFQGTSGFERAGVHERELLASRVPHSFRQEVDGAWTLRFGPLSAAEVAQAMGAFVY